MKYLKFTTLLLLSLLCCSLSYADDIFSTTYGEKWVTIQGVGVTGRYAYVSNNAVKHGEISDTTNPGDEYLWCLVQSGTNVYIYNKSLGNGYQPSVSSSTTSSITFGSSNSNPFTVTSSSYTTSGTTYSGYYIKPTNYTQYWSLYGGESWSTDYPSAVIGYWNTIDHNCLWNIEVYSSSSDEDIISKTYTRDNVTAGSWQSFCVPMNIDIDELKTHFDEIYIPYSGEELVAYSDIDGVSEGGSDDVTGGAKRRSIIRKTSSTSNDDTRYSFAYSADGSKYYHFYIADITSEDEIGIPQCLPFFAHVKSDDTTLTDNTLTLNGYLFSDEEANDASSIVTSFDVYKDQSLTEVDEDKSFEAIGLLTTDATNESYNGTLYTIDATTGSFVTTTSDALELNHAYLLVDATDAEGIVVHPKTMAELLALTSIDDEDPGYLHLTDSNSTLTAGTYKSGKVDYSRTGSYVIDGNYSSFCLPFDFNVSDAACFNKVYVPISVAFYNTTTERLKIFLVNQTGTVKAGTPFIARLTGETINVTNANEVTYDGTATNPDEEELTVFDNNGTSSVLTSNETITLYWGGTLVSTPSKDGMNTFNLDGSFGPRTSTSNLSPFRAYLVETNISSAAKQHEIELSFEDDATGIDDILTTNKTHVDIYNASGMLIRQNVNALNATEGLTPGLYIINGKKVIK